MAKTLLLEIGTEEIPAGFIGPALEFMRRRIADRFAEIGLACGKIETFGTPRRLAIRIAGLPEKMADKTETRMGPARNVAFAADGQPTRAGEGFARSLGVDPAQLELCQTEKGEYVCVNRVIKGSETAAVLPELLNELILAIPFRKTMRWSNPGVRFARPVHWIVALFGGEVLPVTFGNIGAGRITRGNRFMAPGEIEIGDPSQYEELLADNRVIVAPEKRRALAWSELQQAAAAVGATIRDEDLLDEVINLIEYPHVIRGGFDETFLKMPPEVLVTVMRHHQRYFPLYDAQGGLKPYFLAVSNIIPRDDALVRAGNEKVVRARLNDAEYFFREDLKVPLREYADRHRNVIFHKDLGTSHEKVERFTRIALYLADFLAAGHKAKVALAAELSKADLNSLMVYELPELQGIMGREYALAQGIDPDVAQAIYEHYLPTSAEDELPQGVIGDIVGIADRMDTICGFFGIGLVPSGNSDPYALRRQCIAIENILLGKGYRISVSDLIDEALSLLSAKLKRPGPQVREELLEFFKSRFVAILQGRGITGDVIEAVLPGFDDPVDVFMKARALAAVREESWFASITAASKRVENILKKVAVSGAVEESLLAEADEKALFDRLKEVEGPFVSYAGKGEYTAALKLLVGLKDPIDSFFDNVLVMCDDAAVRENRIALLKRLVELFDKIARFSAIAG